MLSHGELFAFTTVVGYFLRVSAAYLLCLLLARLFFRPHIRFLLWISFLFGAGLYWALVLAQLPRNIVVESVVRAGAAVGGPTGFPDLASWTIPGAWRGYTAAIALVLPWGYGVAVALLLLFMLGKHIRLRLVLRRATSVSGEIDRIFVELCDQLQIRHCRIQTLPGLTSPSTAFILHPRVLIPELLELFLDRAQLADVLCHELMHVKRRDYLWAGVSELIRCFLFFHPAAWLVFKHLLRERELACDAAVVRQRGDRRPDYAECLTRLARLQLAERRTSLAINIAASGSFLGLRVRTLLAAAKDRPVWKQVVAVTTSGVLLCGFVALWPELAVVLRFASPAATATLYPGVRARIGHANMLNRRRRRFAQRAEIPHGLPTPISPEVMAEPVLPMPPATVLSNVMPSTVDFLPLGAKSQIPGLPLNAPSSTPTGTGEPPLTETPSPTRKTGSRHMPLLHKVLVGVAAAAIGAAAAEAEDRDDHFIAVATGK